MNTALNDLIQWIPQLVAGQFFFVVLVYFTLMRNRLRKEFPFYVLFLLVFIFFLTIKTVENASLLPIPWHHILYTRMFLLFAVGLPSLTIATAFHSGLHLLRKQVLTCYLAGLCFGCLYLINMDQHWQIWYGSRTGIGLAEHPLLGQLWRIPYPFCQIVAVIALLILPGTFMLCRRPRGRGTLMITGILLFGLFMVIGSALREWWIYYTGSVFSALIWFVAVCRDIRKLRGRSFVLKEEFQLLVQLEPGENNKRLDQLLSELDALSEGNLEVYKLKVREILNMLTDTTIEAGGDSQVLLEQNRLSTQAVDQAQDRETAEQTIRAEALKLSQIVSEIPQQSNDQLIERAKRLLSESYGSDINMDDVAAQLNVSRSHLMAEFKKSVGMTMNQYLTQLRIETAKLLLADRSITDTAFEVGFNNSNYFSTVFKKQTGQTPSQYQQEIT